MSRYNHFSDVKYEQVLFTEIAIGSLFRRSCYHNGRHRKDIICTKTSDLSFVENKSKKEIKILDAAGVVVSSFDLLIAN